MPWSIVQDHADCSGWAVVKDDTGELEGCHDTEQDALDQLAALNAQEEENSMPRDQAQGVRPPRDELFRAIRPGVELREDGEGSSPTLVGHFARFNEWTEIDSFFEGRFMEIIAPGAFKKTFRERTPKVLFQHGHDPQVGDKPIASVETLREDNEGAFYEASLFDGVPQLVMDGLRAGEYGASFRFRVLREEIVEAPKRSKTNPEGLPERTIKEAEVQEFGPVTFPAYAGATAGVRSLTDRITFQRLAHDDAALSQLIEFRNGGAGADPHPARAAQDPEPEEGREKDAPTDDSAGAEPHPADVRRDDEEVPLYTGGTSKNTPEGFLS